MARTRRMYRVLLTPQFKADLRATWEYIRQQLHSPGAAARLRAQALQTAFSLREFPLRFALTGVRPDVRAVPVDNFLIFYLADESAQTVTLLRFLYAASDWQDDI